MATKTDKEKETDLNALQKAFSTFKQLVDSQDKNFALAPTKEASLESLTTIGKILESIEFFQTVARNLGVVPFDHHVTLEEVKPRREALLNHPKLKPLIELGLITAIVFDIESLKKMVSVTPAFTEMHSYPLMHTVDSQEFITQVLIGAKSDGKEDFQTMEDVFNPWPPKSAASSNTLDGQLSPENEEIDV